MDGVVLILLLIQQASADLAAEDFDTRERASTILKASWPLSKPFLLQAASSVDAEAKRRAMAILGNPRPSAAEMAMTEAHAWLARQGWTGWPQVDSCPAGIDWGKYRAKAIEQKYSACGPFYEMDRQATFLLLNDMASNGSSATDLIHLLERMIPVEHEHCKAHGWTWLGPRWYSPCKKQL